MLPILRAFVLRCASGSVGTEGARAFLSRTGWQGGHFKTGTQVCFPGSWNCLRRPSGTRCHSTLFCPSCKVEKCQASQVFFFFSSSGLPSFLPSFWVTAADLAHVHHLPKHNLSDDSSADVAQTRRTFHQSLQRPVTLTHSQPKAFLITEENYWRSGGLRLPSHSLYIRSILNKYFF